MYCKFIHHKFLLLAHTWPGGRGGSGRCVMWHFPTLSWNFHHFHYRACWSSTSSEIAPYSYFWKILSLCRLKLISARLKFSSNWIPDFAMWWIFIFWLHMSLIFILFSDDIFSACLSLIHSIINFHYNYIIMIYKKRKFTNKSLNYC